MEPQLTPCELDAEKAAKRIAISLFGAAHVRAQLDAELRTCATEHREVLQRLYDLDTAADSDVEEQTIRLLQEHANEIRRIQREHGFTIPGLTDLCSCLGGKATIDLLP
jgi:hypothetical protein